MLPLAFFLKLNTKKDFVAKHVYTPECEVFLLVPNVKYYIGTGIEKIWTISSLSNNIRTDIYRLSQSWHPVSVNKATAQY